MNTEIFPERMNSANLRLNKQSLSVTENQKNGINCAIAKLSESENKLFPNFFRFNLRFSFMFIAVSSIKTSTLTRLDTIIELQEKFYAFTVNGRKQETD